VCGEQLARGKGDPSARVGGALVAQLGAVAPARGWIPLRAVGVIAFVVVLVALARADATPQPAGGRGFGPGFWPVAVGEVVALAVGLRLIHGPLDARDASVAWVSFVVGAHFVVLAVVLEERLYAWLGVAIGTCGLAGLGMAALGTGAAPIAVVSGVIPGAVLLAAGWWGTRQAGPAQPRSGRSG
jgi:hypothetical protein